ncbi:hypothetical protein CANCADRAFT_18458, partial [Tortispora caseinolytica NRRL Y-17796]
MLPTPDYDRFDYTKVYEPSEDTYVFLDLLENDMPYLKDSFVTPVILEVGSGSGLISTFLKKNILPASFVLATDISMDACKITQRIASQNSIQIDSINTSMAHGIRSGLVDLLLCNPPYVPTEKLPEPPADGNWIYFALDGGKNGMEFTNKLLNNLNTILSDKGIAYILFCKSNHPEIVTVPGFKKTKVFERQAGWEILSIYRFERN